MELMNLKSKGMLLFAILFIQFVNISINGQSWSIEYILEGDSSVYKLSHDKIIQGQSVDFFFPAYKYVQTSSSDAIQSFKLGNHEILEFEFDSKNISCNEIYFEIDMYAEGIDTISIFLKMTDECLFPLNQQISRQGNTYLPTAAFSVNFSEKNFQTSIKSILIEGRAKGENPKFIIGRLDALKKIRFSTEDKMLVDEFLSRYQYEKQSDIFDKLPDHYLKMHGFSWHTRLVLKDCNSVYDSIQCISQFMNGILNDYRLYEVYKINKDELISRNTLLAKSVSDVESYYKGMKEIIALLNSCHMRLTTNQNDEVESPSQPIYFYNIQDEIVVSAIFDTTLANSICLGDKLISINNIPIAQVYENFSRFIFASTSHQMEMKITQRLLYTAREIWGDSLLLEFQNNTNIYSITLNKTNFTGKRIVPPDFKTASNNMIEKYNNIIYFRPNFLESSLNPLLYSHIEELNYCDGLIVDLRGCSSGDFSCLSFLTFLISKNSLVMYNESSLFNLSSYYIIKPSNIIQIKAPIAIIVDARTTCISELLIKTIRNNRSDVYLIGASNTAGSAQLANNILLPQNAVLTYFDGITKDGFGYIIDDNTGIVPDSLIHFESYKDLFPYEDKLKHLALKYLGCEM